MGMCTGVCVCVWVLCIGFQVPKAIGVGSPAVAVTADVIHLMQVLGTELRSSVRAAYAFNIYAFFAAPPLLVILFAQVYHR